jgi:hypothetical protein
MNGLELYDQLHATPGLEGPNEEEPFNYQIYSFAVSLASYDISGGYSRCLRCLRRRCAKSSAIIPCILFFSSLTKIANPVENHRCRPTKQ